MIATASFDFPNHRTPMLQHPLTILLLLFQGSIFSGSPGINSFRTKHQVLHKNRALHQDPLGSNSPARSSSPWLPTLVKEHSTFNHKFQDFGRKSNTGYSRVSKRMTISDQRQIGFRNFSDHSSESSSFQPGGNGGAWSRLISRPRRDRMPKFNYYFYYY